MKDWKLISFGPRNREGNELIQQSGSSLEMYFKSD